MTEENKTVNGVEKKYWFYNWPVWVRTLLCIFFFPIFIPILVWPLIKLKMHLKVLLVIVWIILVLIFSNLNSEPDKLVLNVSGISEGEVIKDATLKLEIKTTPLTVDEVTINGESVNKSGWNSEYSYEKAFPEGENKIVIKAKNGEIETEKSFNFNVDFSQKQDEEIKNNSVSTESVAEEANLVVDEEVVEGEKEEIIESSLTISQKNAISKAKSYLDFSSFSRDGLVDQLVFEKFSVEDAQYGADNSGADWNEQASKKAKSYLDFSSFSRDGLVDQLVFEKFTPVQAEYGVNTVGL